MRTIHFHEQDNVQISVCHATEAAVHEHAYLELAYVTEGTAYHVIDGQRSQIRRGDYFIIDYHTSHTYRSVDGAPFTVINCLFHPEFIDKSLAGCDSLRALLRHYLIRMSPHDMTVAPFSCCFFDSDGVVYSLLSRMQTEYEDKKPGYREIMRANLISILILSMRSLSATESEEGGIAWAKRYIHEHYTEKITLSQLAKHMNYSVPHLCRKFREETGVTFSEYLDTVRADAACRLLANTQERVIDIASYVGYRDTDSFLRMFRSICGMSPREYRRLKR